MSGVLCALITRISQIVSAWVRVTFVACGPVWAVFSLVVAKFTALLVSECDWEPSNQSVAALIIDIFPLTPYYVRSFLFYRGLHGVMFSSLSLSSVEVRCHNQICNICLFFRSLEKTNPGENVVDTRRRIKPDRKVYSQHTEGKTCYVWHV